MRSIFHLPQRHLTAILVTAYWCLCAGRSPRYGLQLPVGVRTRFSPPRLEFVSTRSDYSQARASYQIGPKPADSARESAKKDATDNHD